MRHERPVGRQMFVAGGRSDQVDTVRGDAARGEVVQQLRLDRGIAEQIILDQQSRGDVGAQNAGPDVDDGAGQPVRPGERAVGHVAVGQHGRL